ncbi:hypothetical protein K8S19_07895 [bacterium]|nr:hypothetical protein [bacterium]
MAKTKGTDVVALRKLFAGVGEEKLDAFREKLAPELFSVFENIIHTSWTPIQEQTDIYEAAARVLFPGDPERMHTLGKAMAARSYSTVYKLFLRIPTIQFVLSRVAIMWRSYHDKGEATVEGFENNQGIFIVRKYPDLPRKMRVVIGGHLEILLELTGAKNIKILVRDNDPDAWHWDCLWE